MAYATGLRIPQVLRSFLAVASALALGLSGCGTPKGKVEVGYSPPVVPIRISLNSNGDVSASISGKIQTPIGAFDVGLGGSSPLFPRKRTLTVRYDGRDTVYELVEGRDFELTYDHDEFRSVAFHKGDKGDIFIELRSVSYSEEMAVSSEMIVEEFDDSSVFSQVSNNVWISGGRAHWSVSRSGGEQYIYRSISPFRGDVRITVKGQVDSWTNNCGVSAGIGDGYRSGIGVSYGFYGGGCLKHGAVIRASGAKLDNEETNCRFSGSWLWIEPKTMYEATLTVERGAATLAVSGIGNSTGRSTYSGEYNTIYVGMHGGGDWPECSGSIESIVVEPLQ